LGHTGVNNAFLEATHDTLAITYNDISILENHHVSSAFALLLQEECDWTSSFEPADFKDFRETVVQMVLGTDMRMHFDHLTHFKAKTAGDAFEPAAGARLDRKDVRFLLVMALHAADICNPAKPKPLALEWCRRGMDEFFNQGDLERSKGLPLSPFMDRKKHPLSATVINCQIGFINVLVTPLLTEWCTFLGEAAERDIITHLSHNTQLWETQGTATVETFPPFVPTSRPMPSTAAGRVTCGGGAEKRLSVRPSHAVSQGAHHGTSHAHGHGDGHANHTHLAPQHTSEQQNV